MNEAPTKDPVVDPKKPWLEPFQYLHEWLLELREAISAEDYRGWFANTIEFTERAASCHLINRQSGELKPVSVPLYEAGMRRKAQEIVQDIHVTVGFWWNEATGSPIAPMLEQATPAPTAEADPNGLEAHEPGSKLDLGKTRVGLVFSGFSRALQAVSEVGTYGAAKYTPEGWMKVPDGQSRYGDALGRHWLKVMQGEGTDPESGLLHLAHMAWNALAILELELRRETYHNEEMDL